MPRRIYIAGLPNARNRISVAYSGYHKHSAYIVENADMPGSRKWIVAAATLVLAHRRS